MGNCIFQLYGSRVTVYTDHAAIKAVLGVPNLGGKYARWWNKVYASGIREVDIVYRAKHNNCYADALSQLALSPPLDDDSAEEVQVAFISSQETDDADITTLLSIPLFANDGFADKQWSDCELQPMILYLRDGELPDNVNLARRIATEIPVYTMVDNILY